MKTETSIETIREMTIGQVQELTKQYEKGDFENGKN